MDKMPEKQFKFSMYRKLMEFVDPKKLNLYLSLNERDWGFKGVRFMRDDN